MTVLPEPLTHADCDLRGMPGFMLNTERLLSSELWALSDGNGFKAAMALWCRAWRQVPAASLPDDDKILAAFAGIPMSTLKRKRDIILRGFVKCSDGRLYHRTLAEDANKAWLRRAEHLEKKEADRERLKRWREAKRNKGETEMKRVSALLQDEDETDMKRVSAPLRNEDETPVKRLRQGQGQGQGQQHPPQPPPCVSDRDGHDPGTDRGAGREGEKFSSGGMDPMTQAMAEIESDPEQRAPPAKPVRSVADWLMVHRRAFRRDNRDEWRAAYERAGWDVLTEAYQLACQRKDRDLKSGQKPAPIFLDDVTEFIDWETD